MGSAKNRSEERRSPRSKELLVEKAPGRKKLRGGKSSWERKASRRKELRGESFQEGELPGEAWGTILGPQ